MKTQVRLAETRDVAAIFRVRTSVNENLLSVAQMAEMGITEASIAAMMRKEACAWVAVVDNEVVGFSMVNLAEGSLFALFVLPAHEGQGIGKRLAETAEVALFGRHTIAWLETGRATRAAGFYRHLGWSDETEIDDENIRLYKRLGYR